MRVRHVPWVLGLVVGCSAAEDGEDTAASAVERASVAVEEVFGRFDERYDAMVGASRSSVYLLKRDAIHEFDLEAKTAREVVDNRTAGPPVTPVYDSRIAGFAGDGARAYWANVIHQDERSMRDPGILSVMALDAPGQPTRVVAEAAPSTAPFGTSLGVRRPGMPGARAAQVTYHEGYVYWLSYQFSESTLKRAPAKGGPAELVGQVCSGIPCGAAHTIVVDKDSAYVVDVPEAASAARPPHVVRLPLKGGSESERIALGTPMSGVGYNGLVVDDKALFVLLAQHGETRIQRYDKASKTVSTIASVPTRLSPASDHDYAAYVALVGYEDSLLFCDADGAITKVPKTGGPARVLGRLPSSSTVAFPIGTLNLLIQGSELLVLTNQIADAKYSFQERKPKASIFRVRL